MQALVKMPHIEITAKGEIPKRILTALKKEFGDSLEINDEDELIDIKETEWYKNMKASQTPGDSVQVYRYIRKMTQAALGDIIGVSARYVSDMENGKRGISKEMAKKLSKVLKAPVERFL
jgi:DNA-binding XRE family transcriptional regulator